MPKTGDRGRSPLHIWFVPFMNYSVCIWRVRPRTPNTWESAWMHECAGCKFPSSNKNELRCVGALAPGRPPVPFFAERLTKGGRLPFHYAQNGRPRAVAPTHMVRSVLSQVGRLRKPPAFISLYIACHFKLLEAFALL
jgi:hypothetical protein